jgi:hypothetical protein
METEKLDLGIGLTLYFSEDSFIIMGNGFSTTIPHKDCALFSNSIHTMTTSLKISYMEANIISKISGKEIKSLKFEA